VRRLWLSPSATHTCRTRLADPVNKQYHDNRLRRVKAGAPGPGPVPPLSAPLISPQGNCI
jgi:hypothetical protein